MLGNHTASRAGRDVNVELSFHLVVMLGTGM